MATFVYDTFTEGSNTALVSHTPEIGGTWTQHSAATVAGTVYSATDTLATDGSTNAAINYNDADPGADNYTIEAVVNFATVTSSNHVGVIGRVSAAAQTYYWAFYNHASVQWELRKLVAGASTTLDTALAANTTAGTITTGVDYTIRLELGTNTQDVYLDDELILSATDGDITARGFAGIITKRGGSGTGPQITSISGTNAVATATFAGEIQTDGKTMRCVFTKSSGTWTSPAFGTERAAISVGGDTIYSLSAGSITLSAADTVATFDVALGGYVEQGDTATVTFAAGFMTDVGGGINTDAESGTSLTNSSTTTLSASALSRQVGHPIARWAVLDALPWTGAEAKLGVAEGDNFSGTEKTVFTFFEADGTTPLSVDVGTATGVYATANTLTATARTYDDLRGFGVYDEYFIAYVDTSSLPAWSDATDDVIVKAVVHCWDGTTKTLGDYTLRPWPSSPNIIYVACTTGDDLGAGTIGDPVQTLTAAHDLLDDTVDGICFLEAGTYDHTTTDVFGEITSRDKFLRIYADEALTQPDWTADHNAAAGDGDVKIDSGSFQMGDYCWVQGITHDGGGVPSTTAAALGFRTDGNQTHVCLENCHNNYGSIFHGTGPTYNESNFPFSTSSHVALIAYRQSEGFRGPLLAACDNVIVQGMKISGGGTTQFTSETLIEQMYTQDLFEHADFGTYYPGAHSDILHSQPVAAVEIDEVIVRNCYDEGSDNALGMLCEYGVKNTLFQNIAYWRRRDNYCWQIGNAVRDNWQVVNCVVLRPGAGDVATTSWASDSSDGVGTPQHICVINTVGNNIQDMSASVLGSFRHEGNQADDGYSWCAFTDADVTTWRPDLRPDTGSPLLASAVAVDHLYDIEGTLLYQDATDAIGVYAGHDGAPGDPPDHVSTTVGSDGQSFTQVWDQAVDEGTYVGTIGGFDLTVTGGGGTDTLTGTIDGTVLKGQTVTLNLDAGSVTADDDAEPNEAISGQAVTNDSATRGMSTAATIVAFPNARRRM